MIQRKEYDKLIQYDQLTLSRKNDPGLNNLTEAKINFAPTYKYISGSNNFINDIENLRTPSWTDRILFCNNRQIRNIDYSSIPQIMYSDHRPVQGCFEIYLKPPEQRNNLGLNYNNNINENNRFNNNNMYFYGNNNNNNMRNNNMNNNNYKNVNNNDFRNNNNLTKTMIGNGNNNNNNVYNIRNNNFNNNIPNGNNKMNSSQFNNNIYPNQMNIKSNNTFIAFNNNQVNNNKMKKDNDNDNIEDMKKFF